MKSYFTRHLQVLVATLGDLVHSPTATLLTVLMIGVTLALPAGLYVGLLNLEQLSHGWHRGGSLSVYLQKGAAGQNVAATISRMKGVQSARYISPEQGLQEFEKRSGFGDALATLHHNPLPGVVVVTPDSVSPKTLATLVDALKAAPDVAHVQSNLAWLERLDAALAFGHRLVIILSGLLGLAVVLILGNTTRVAVVNRATEIDIIRLVGGTDAFIRRPFLYAGALTGGLGALCALLLLELSLMLLSGPIHRLDTLYASHYTLVGLGLGRALKLLAFGTVFGWLGARLAVGRQLRLGPR
ncbi:MAG TPA: permease-like cell division protein FtsX [Acidiferrobacter sp.]|nr:permease-like cell division protein FtsX [Acidiferrobacter sp.]